MKDFEPQAYETELASLKPARLPDHLSADLTRALVGGQPRLNKDTRREPPGILGWLRWAIPVGGVAGLIVCLTLNWRLTSRNPQKRDNDSTPVAVLKPDTVLLSQELVANFEAVTRLPDGSPIRLRCEEWMDEVQLRDPVRGVWVEHRKPRLEVHAIGYETY